MELLIYIIVSILIGLGISQKVYHELRNIYAIGLLKSMLVSIGLCIVFSITRPYLVGCAIAEYLGSNTKSD